MATPGLKTTPAVHVAGVKGQKNGQALGLAGGVVNSLRYATFDGGSMGFIKGIAFLGGPTDLLGNSTPGRHLTTGVLRNNTEGNPAQPSLQLNYGGSMWRFRWSVQAGSRYIQVNCKQVNNGASRPTLVVKAATGILASDQTGTAASSTGWVVISVSFTALAAGVLWVELHNNDYAIPRANGSSNAINPCYFDHIVST